MGFFRFYWECLKLAWGAAAWARSINFIITILAPIVTYAVPNTPWFKETMPNAYVWLQQMPAWITWTPLALFLSFFIIRLLLAPYWMYKELASERDKLREISITNAEKKKIRNDLSQFLTEINRLLDECRKVRGTKQEIQAKDTECSERIRKYLSSEPLLGTTFVALYGSSAGITVPKIEGAASGTFHGKLYSRLYWQAVRLQEFIEEFSS